MMSSVRVAVRVRPLNNRERRLSSKVIIQMKGNTTSIDKPSPVRGNELKDKRQTFSYDFSYDSFNRGSPTFASQEKVFQDLGSDVLKAAFEGFNACVLAYGQTGSGKSYTMMGHTEDKGLIPRICEGLLCEMSHRSQMRDMSFRTEVSYLEIYKECVQDLLKKNPPPTHGGGLRVREHPRDGPYVENLSKHLVHNHGDMEDLIILGNANRAKVGTGMNDFSSRSHAIFTIMFTQAWFDADLPRQTLSKIHMVDLAGSERADATCTTGTRLKEGAIVNKSLVTLANVISALADRSVGGQVTKKKQIFIPYRDSVLTWLLKDSLGGNSMTTVIATISPADVNYRETLNTLHYASRAKNIVNSPMVNEDNSVKVIRELQAEVTRLQRRLEESTQVFYGDVSSSVMVEEKLRQNEAKVVALTNEWTSKWRDTQSILQDEAVALRKQGSGVVLRCRLPHLIGIDEDLLSAGIILYYLKEGRTLIGSDEASCSWYIVLRRPGLLGEHCVLENRAGTVTLFPQDGALCSVNGSMVTDSCQLTQGAIIELGRGTMLRFYNPTEASHLREKHQRALSVTDWSKSTERPSKVMLQNSGLFSNMDEAEAEPPKIFHTSTPIKKFKNTAIPGRFSVPHTSFELDGDALQGGVSSRDGPERERDSCHKSGPELMSARRQRKAQSEVGVASYRREEVWSGDASLQQTSVLGPGDGCGTKPEGNANEIQGVVTDCYKGRPGSGGSSLSSMSHLQSSGGTRSISVLPPTSTHSQLDREPLSSHATCCPTQETTFEGHFSCGEMDESGGREEIPGETAGATFPNSGLGSLLRSRVPWSVQDAGRLLWSSYRVLQQVTKITLPPIGAQWSSHAVSVVRASKVLSVVKNSQVFSMVRGSFVFSLFRNSHIFSMVKDLPLMQHIRMNITQHLQPAEAAQMIQDCNNPDNTQLTVLTTTTQTLSKGEDVPDDVHLIPEDLWKRNSSIMDLLSPQEKDLGDIQGYQRFKAIQGDKLITEPLKHNTKVTHTPKDRDLTLRNSTVQLVIQALIEFPDSLLNLQTLPLLDLMDALKSHVSMPVLSSQKIVALHWLNVAKCSQPEPQPALLILMETGCYTLTTDSTGLLVLFNHLPMLQLREMQIGLAGHSLRLMSTTEESILVVYTYSQKHTKELCCAILDVIYPGDSRISQHPLFQGNLMDMSLDWKAYVPDLLLDAGLKVGCQFQRCVADLIYLLHCNMDQETVTLGEVQLLLYTSVAVRISPSTQHLAQFLLTRTHLGLVQENAVFHPTPHSVTAAPCHPQFHGLTLRQCSDVRCMLVHDEDKNGSVRLDVILANVRGRGHPESVAKATSPSAHSLNSSPHAEVWKLTFSCSTEAACLINHLSNV